MKYQIVKKWNLHVVQERKFFFGKWKLVTETRKDGTFPQGFFSSKGAEDYLDFVKAKRKK